ncbi:MAG: hypothetical protein AAGD43_16375 [Pseudomonadota bacterium]
MRELDVVKAERDRAQQACAQIQQRVPIWRSVADDPPTPGVEVLAYYPRHKLTDDGDFGEIVPGRGARCVVTAEPDGGWDEPEWLNFHGDYFGNDYSFAPKPALWAELLSKPENI